MSTLRPTVRPGALIARIKRGQRVDRLVAAADAMAARHGASPERLLAIAKSYDDAGWAGLAEIAGRSVPGPDTRARVLEVLEARVAESRRGLLR